MLAWNVPAKSVYIAQPVIAQLDNVSPYSITGLELVGPSKRVWTGILIHAFFAVGLCYLSGVSWLLRNWHLIQILVGGPCVLYLSYWWYVYCSVNQFNPAG